VRRTAPAPTAAGAESGAERRDPRIARTARACKTAIVELAAERPISQVSVADLAERAGVTRATFYNHYDNPLALLIEVLVADLERAHLDEDRRRSEGNHSSAEMLRLSIADVAEHIERFEAVYRLAVDDPADGGVYEALVRHFSEYAVTFIGQSNHPGLPTANRGVIAQFLAHGFAGAIKAWLSDPSVSKDDLIDASTACAPVWWS
jgi:AcrR family transcriptional regulator